MTEPNEEKQEGTKAGARHSAADIADMQTLHDIAVRQGAKCETVHYPDAAKTDSNFYGTITYCNVDGTVVKVEEIIKPESPAGPTPIKATSLDMEYTVYNTPPLAIKIAGEMELDVCYMPYSGQKNGKDSDGQYFSPRTNEHAEKFPTPLVLYYHGYERQGVQQPMPVEIGIPTGKKWTDKAGRWLRVKLEGKTPEEQEKADTVWKSAKKGNARGSSDSVAHLVRVSQDGEILNWPFVGISLFETETGKKPANSYAFALPAAKALGLAVEEEDSTDDLKAIAAAIVAAYKK